MDTFQYADIIILALIAGFVLLRLRNTLGKDIGHRPDPTQLRQQIVRDIEERGMTLPGRLAAVEKKTEALNDKAFQSLNDEQKQMLDGLMKEDTSFVYGEFLEGAKGAFEWVLKAFNDGDKSTLKQLMSKEVYQEFESAMIDQASSTAKAHATLVAITSATITGAEILADKARITLKFSSDQVQVVRNDKGEIISGNASEIIKVEDEWTFERPLKSRDPNWIIVET